VYASVDARRLEIATVRALGFNGLPVITSILAESMLFAFQGAVPLFTKLPLNASHAI
jgi:ABC-type antimicrobial peptide transport system permease subunit